MTLPAAGMPSNSALLLLMQLVVILATGRLVGLLFKALRQPQVIAEILAGLALGPSLFGLLWPEGFAALFPVGGFTGLKALSQVGLTLFMFVVGIEFDPGKGGVGRAAPLIGFGGIALSLSLGVVLGLGFYPELAPPEIGRLPFALFLGTALSATAFPVLARILSERALLNTSVGALALAAAAVADLVAWCLVAACVSVIRSHGSAETLRIVGFSLLYLVGMIWGVRPLLARVAARFGRDFGLTPGGMALVLVLMLSSAALAEWIGMHALLGAFLFGAVVPREERLIRALTSRIEELVVVLFLPIFFASTGLETQLSLALAPGMVGPFLLLLAAAVGGKVFGSLIPARMQGISWRDGVTLGVLMNTRGLVELVILSIGRDLGVLTPALFSAMVLVAVMTTVMTSPLLSLLQPALSVVERQVREGKVPRGPKTLLVCIAREESAPGFARIAAALASGGEVCALHLQPIAEGVSLSGATPDIESAASQRLVDELKPLRVSARALSFPSSDLGADIARVAGAEEVGAVLLGFHQPLIGTAVLGGPLKEAADQLKVTLYAFLDRGQSPIRRVVLGAGGEHEAAALAAARRLAVGGVLQVVEPDAGPEGLISAAQDADLVVVGVGAPWGMELKTIELRPLPILQETRASLLAVKSAEA